VSAALSALAAAGVTGADELACAAGGMVGAMVCFFVCVRVGRVSVCVCGAEVR
jgi:hypothetical protein